MQDLVVALGLVAVIEGLLYAAAPTAMKRLFREAEAMPERTMRLGGLVAMGIGVIVIWMVRG